MRHTRQRRQGVFPWIRRGFMLFCCMLVAPGSGAGVVPANPLYTTTVPCFSDNLDTGAGNQPPTVLMVVYGTADLIEQRLKSAVANLHDFTQYPEGNLEISPELGTEQISLVLPDGVGDDVVTDSDAGDVGDLSGLAFRPIEEEDFLAMHPGDLLFFSMGPTEINTIQPMLSAREILLEFTVESLRASDESAIPEASSLLLVGIGVLGLVGLGLTRGARKSAKAQSR